ncbi:MAG: TonB-dependent receptor [Acidobacteria bacterium]|nr:TonB-dependent receptor [Acidobacteriota bacterium]
MSRHWRSVVVLAGVWLLVAASVASAQTTGRISGVVKDTSGGVLPGVTVTVLETRSGFTQSDVTDARGIYTFVNLPLGDYRVIAELQSFKKASKEGLVLVADGRLGIDFMLEVGAFTETVQVTVESETVNTISGEVSRTVDRAQVQDLALNGRNYMQMVTLIPGAPLVDTTSPLDLMTGLGINTTVNGSRTNASLLTVDGGFNMDAGSNNSQISNVGVDFIDQVTIKTSNFSAEYGRNSGAVINVVTRSGSNALKGSVFEYMRRARWDENDYFNNLKKVAKPTLTYDDPGFSLGGPIAKDKIFFFGGLEWKRIRRLTAPSTRTLPTSLMRSGNFSQLSATIKDPLTGQQFSGNVIPANRITADGKAIANVYEAMSKVAAQYNDSVLTNNTIFQDDNPFNFRQEMLRLDYQPSGAHRLTTRLVFDHYNLIEPGGTFINSQMPTVPTNRKRPGRNVQVNHYWTLKNNLVNEAKFNYSGNGQIIPPVGDAWKRTTYGFQFPQLYSGGGNYPDSIPDVDFTGGYATFRGAAQSLLSPTWDYSFSDNVTWIKGDHTLKSGLLVLYNQKNQNGRSSYDGSVSFNTSGNPNSTGNAFADALLGNYRTYQEAQLDPIGYFRYWQFEGFVSDAWRVSDRLSIEGGLRWAWQMPTITLGNNTTSFDPALYNAANAVTVLTNGTIVAGSGNRYNGLTKPGTVPSSQTANVPNANSPDVASIPIAASNGYYKRQNLWAPRFSFAWKPLGDDSTAVRGGVGLFYDRPEGNLYFALANNPPFSLSSSYENGNLANPAGGAASALAPWASMNALDPNLKIPRVWNWSIGVQRELGFLGLFGEITYVGNKGQNLIRQPDINRPSFADLEANAAGPKYNTNYLRPYKGYSNILLRLSDAESNYHALQLFLSRRRGNVNFTINYTYSRARDNGSGNGDNLDTGADWHDLGYNWGPSDNDRTHVLVTTWTYRLPFWLNRQDILGSVLGGWEISGIARFQTGAPFTVSGNTAIGTRRADFTGGGEQVSNAGSLLSDNSVAWLDATKFAAAPESRLGNSGRNSFVGPGYQQWDISLRKQFRVKGNMKAQFQADFFNAFNNLNLRNPATTVTNAGFGTITSAAPLRNVQLGLRFTF